MQIRSIHPFPARMAPELALASLGSLAPNSVVLDPMSGSGTVLRQALALGHRAIGFDMDPLAVLMSRVWTRPVDEKTLDREVRTLMKKASEVDLRSCALPWHDSETAEFVQFWFDRPQRRALTRIAFVLHNLRRSKLSTERQTAVDAISIALSRIIVTKEQGASLARDTSHSRPHRVADTSDYDVNKNFLRSIEELKRRLTAHPVKGAARVKIGDARKLKLSARSVDAVLTSPPYLNAIDYLRGHRMALVWLGRGIKDLRDIRARTIGAERASEQAKTKDVTSVVEAMCVSDHLTPRQVGMVERYATDLLLLLSQVHRVLKPTGQATFVVGNSCLKDIFVQNSRGVEKAAELAHLRLSSVRERELPAGSRYLPMTSHGALSKRMRTETVMTFAPTNA